MILETSRWYVVQARPNCESKAVRHLERQGFVTYLPRFLKKRRHARRIEIVPAPLFPRYLFVAMDVAVQRWRSIQSTVGVTQLVCNGDSPVAVPSSVVAQLRQREDGQGFIKLDQRPNFAPGDKVRIIDGIFEASIGLFEGMTDGERVAILLDLLGRKVRIFLDGDSVAAA